MAARVRRRHLSLLLLFVAAVGVVCAAGLASYRHFRWGSRWSFGSADFLASPRNLLVVGTDRSGKGAHGALFVVLRLDPRSHQVTAVSLPPRTQTTISGYGVGKLSDAPAVGGAMLARGTVESLFATPVDRAVAVDPTGLAAAVDAAGGLDVDVTTPVHLADPSRHLVLDLPAGRRHLAGKQAVLYAELPSGDAGDLRRVNRQQYLIFALCHALTASAGKQDAVFKALEKAAVGDLAARDAEQTRRFLASRPFIRFALVPGNAGFDGAWIPNPMRMAALMTRISALPAARHGSHSPLAEVLYAPVQEAAAAKLATALGDAGMVVVRKAPLDDDEPASIVSRDTTGRLDGAVRKLVPAMPWFLSDDPSPYSADYTITIGTATP